MSTSDIMIFPSLHGDDVPAKSRPLLEKIESSFGFVPNLFAAFANSPTLLAGYMDLEAAFSQGTLRPGEKQLILLTASVANDCDYCIAAHSTFAKHMLKVPADVVASVRSGEPVADAKLDALVNLTRELVLSRGHASAATIASFLEAGYRKEQIGEVLVGIAMKTMSNYADHLSPVAIDDAFGAER